jgi:hypothetical protein
MELIKDYYLEVHYHPGKANVVADVLSHKHCNYVTLEPYNEALCEDMRKLNLQLVKQGNLYAISIEYPLHERISMAQLNDEKFRKSNRSWKKEIPSLTISGGMTKELFGSVKD